jgi:hypothetical protein
MRSAPLFKSLRLGLLHGGLLYIALLLPGASARASSGASADALLATAGVTTTSHLVPATGLLNGDTVLLSRGATYRARLKLNFFQCFASRSKIVRKLQERGFSAVRLFMSTRELPGDWPRAFRSKSGHCERYAEATWTRDTRQQKRPSAIEKVWLLK